MPAVSMAGTVNPLATAVRPTATFAAREGSYIGKRLLKGRGVEHPSGMAPSRQIHSLADALRTSEYFKL